MEAWRATNFDSSAKFTANMTVYWRNVEVPKYKIVLSGTNVLSTSTNVIYLELYNYASTDSNLQLSWSFSPNVTNSSTLLKVSQDNSVATISAGGFNFSTAYSLTVVALNKRYPAESQNVQVFAFEIGHAPTGGTASVNPETGIFLKTTFYFQISGWTPAKGTVKFRVFGYQDS
mmetsp:Transcript_5104/g.3759  ORF Transcript_5104/g.3759 Transcript_5104/m.3759 type:complete len:174 (+) Transcript_5104:2180-2701(+)